jgi:hypothetical protein
VYVKQSTFYSYVSPCTFEQQTLWICVASLGEEITVKFNAKSVSDVATKVAVE